MYNWGHMSEKLLCLIAAKVVASCDTSKTSKCAVVTSEPALELVGCEV